MAMKELQKQTNANIQAKANLGDCYPPCWLI